LHGKRAGVSFELNGKEHQIHSVSWKKNPGPAGIFLKNGKVEIA
jgi:hypothetical protein